MDISNLIKRFFYLFLDISGSLLGIFLIFLGWWMGSGKPTPSYAHWIVIGLGIAALLIHGSHYVIARRHGSEYFRTTRKDK